MGSDAIDLRSCLRLKVRTCPDMLAHGFSIKLLNQLIRDGLVTARTKRVIRGERSIEIVHMKITDAGRQALADRPTLADPRPERRGGR